MISERAPTRNPQSAIPNSQAVRILIADDEPCILEVCSRVAASLGYECMTARDGSEAARLVDEHAFDIVLTDVRMPGSNGFQLFQHIKRPLRRLPWP